MRRIATLSLSLGLLLQAGSFASAAPAALAAPTPSAPAPAARFTDAEKADLKRVADYLNSLKSVQGRFLQIDGFGRTLQGNFYLRKPGRVRFEYQKPNPNLANLLPVAHIKDDLATGVTISVTGLAYNTKVYAEKGWAPPTSWLDLADPKLKGRVQQLLAKVGPPPQAAE